MATVFRYRLRRMRGQILGWGGSMALLAMLIMSFYDTIVQQQAELEELMHSFPPAVSAFFGDITQIATPEGFLHARYFALAPIILGIYAVLAGSGLIVADEENGRLDLIMAHPISRTTLFLGRFLAFVVAMAGILAIAWLGLSLGLSWSTMDVSPGALALPFGSVFAVLLVFGSLALMLSLLLPSRRMAGSVAGLLLVASYFITSLANLNDSLDRVAQASPLNYYQGGNAIRGLDLGWTLGLLLAAAIFTAIAWWRFERRDIRVGGEGGWRLPRLRRAAARVP